MELIELTEALRARADHSLEDLDPARVQRAKRAFVTRRVPGWRLAATVHGRSPRSGDLVLARVERLGQHTGLQLVDGRRAKLFVGDEIIVAYGARYAPNQFESALPDDLEPCHLVAAGGMASRVLSKHRRIKRPTQITPLGLLADSDGAVINLADHALPRIDGPTGAATVIAVAGTAMDAGKTTAAADLINGLVRAGRQVGAAKVTGTGACGDFFHLRDAGAIEVLDFTDLGYGSTCGLGLPVLEAITLQLIARLEQAGAETIVLELADGLLQAETRALIRSDVFAERVDRVLFCAPDAIGAVSGVDWLEQEGLEVCGIAGSLTAAPLAVREAVSASRLPVLTRAQLNDPGIAEPLADGRLLSPVSAPSATRRVARQ